MTKRKKKEFTLGQWNDARWAKKKGRTVHPDFTIDIFNDDPDIKDLPPLTSPELLVPRLDQEFDLWEEDFMIANHDGQYAIDPVGNVQRVKDYIDELD